MPTPIQSIHKLLSLSLITGFILTGTLAQSTFANDASDISATKNHPTIQQHRHRKISQQRWKNMSDEERAAWKEKRKARREKWQNMSDEERAAWKEKRKARREKWQNMSDEERAAWKEKRKARREKWQNMSPEEKKAFKEQHPRLRKAQKHRHHKQIGHQENQ